ncbi:SPRY-domain-containing protein [Sparassis crispa]|uniref:SPRY-domain-containing protein n=1 Tax=Sparassis crispa TaxID=139825 RepID=A0A401G7X6_9APHY|nr:SPRY-domain-containing protein [Sparassis crispa]GBE78271.1 SPRY-domain-containing protein [Sparassis crispa]
MAARTLHDIYTSWNDTADALSAGAQALRDTLAALQPPSDALDDPSPPAGGGTRDAFYILLPLLIILSTFLFLLLLFLVCVVILRRRRGIMLRDNDGPIDMSREEFIQGDGGFEGVESRWLEGVTEVESRPYLRAKDYQLHYPPNSMPTDITLSQFLSIQEKGVSAWSFEPDFEAMNAMLVHARTEVTFLPDPSSASSVQSNLPLPKLNEVYYWEVKMFDLPETTNVAVGLATKPYPSFRLPGLSRYSVAYHSSGDKSHNYPFTATPCGSPLKEGDVLGVGFRPRTGTVFFTKNGRKMEDAFIGLNNWNLFPTLGADGPCSVHVNLGQSGFVFIEANVKKWGLAPSQGTLAPPPAYGSERGSILLAAGGAIIPSGTTSPHSTAEASTRSRRSHRSRRPRSGPVSNAPVESSPLRSTPLTSPSPPDTPPPPITPIEEESESTSAPSSSRRYISPTDMPFHTARNANIPSSPTVSTDVRDGDSTPVDGDLRSESESAQSSRSHSRDTGSEFAIHVQPPPESPMEPTPPTPNARDIHLQAFASSSAPGSVHTDGASPLARNLDTARHDPPAYSPLDAYAYSEGVQLDLPAELIAAALERGTIPSNMIAPGVSRSDDRQRSRRDRR